MALLHIFTLALATVFLAGYFSTATPKDPSRITEQTYVLEHVLKGKP